MTLEERVHRLESHYAVLDATIKRFEERLELMERAEEYREEREADDRLAKELAE